LLFQFLLAKNIPQWHAMYFLKGLQR